MLLFDARSRCPTANDVSVGVNFAASHMAGPAMAVAMGHLVLSYSATFEPSTCLSRHANNHSYRNIKQYLGHKRIGHTRTT